MNYWYLKIGIIGSFTLAAGAVIIRAFWQIIVIPTSETMVIFIPLIFALMSANVLVVYLTIRPGLQKLRRRTVLIGVVAVATAGLMAGVSHYVNFIPSPEAAPLPSKIIGTLILLSSLTAYLFLLYFIWSFRKNREK